MRVKRIVLDGFFGHRQTDLELPDKGIVAVSGATGSGKSALIEAVAMVYGETLRGTPPWESGVAGTVEVVTDAVRVSRTCTAKGKASLLWCQNNLPATRFESQTKAQDALTAYLGVGFETWRRSCVFTSRGVSAFTGATDAERKRLIESFLGVTRFDDALKYAQQERRAVLEEKARVDRDLAVASARRETAQRVLDQGVPRVTLPHHADIDAAKAAREILSSEAQGALDCWRSAHTQATAAQANATRMAHRVESLRHTHCDYCKQEIPLAGRDKLLADAEKNLSAAESLYAELKAASDAAQDSHTAMQAIVADADREVDRLRGLVEEANRAAQAAARYTALADDVRLYEQHCRDLQEQLDGWTEKAEVWGYAVDGLGLRGVRAKMLGGVLAALTDKTNHWLTYLAPGSGIQVEVRPFTENKSGGVADKIDMQIAGAGKGYGYKGASSGQQRVVDLAMLLALSGIAAASNGLNNPTLFFDEPFDTLDASLRDRVAQCLVEMAADRCVVLISHDEMLKSIPAVKRVVVDGGKVR